MSNLTYCASNCRNWECPRHQANAPDGWDVSYALFHKDCSEFIPLEGAEPTEDPLCTN